jgi:Rrf2 family iron-sulfur cluster assembly transcriptional regulator
MKVGSKGRYAVIAILDVARHSGSGAVPLADVAMRQRISLSYLEQLFALLRRSGVVQSARGPGGGYRLARSPSETTIKAIFEAVEDPVSATARDQASAVVTAPLWLALDRSIRSFLGAVTVEDVLAGRLEGANEQAGSQLSRLEEVA